ncbi:hypothetical protein WKR88_03160 [Trinickia caryophylli]|nr:hypothetical protein [Trinickia caryophylli]WQE15567.1 hypothetical protein U0034_23900 [Trinickia caryophylli]GLU33681.1 hypothetical protein Busp01_35230 [Trinickia caryophylli]
MARRLNSAAPAGPRREHAAARRNPVRIAAKALLAASIVATLVCGLATGLARLGLTLPTHALSRAAWHGVLMLPVFFGAVISLERAVALGHAWSFSAPIAAVLSGIALLAGAPVTLVQTGVLVASLVLVAGSVVVFARQPALYLGVLAIAAACWSVGACIWLVTGDALAAVPHWLAFVVLTIVAERLELTRMRPLRPRAIALFCVSIVVMLVSLVWVSVAPEAGIRLFAASIVLLAGWLAAYDIARYTVRQKGLTRFIAVCLLSGYGWFAAAGVLGLEGALLSGHPWHDAALHAVTVGFVFSMVFGHAPIIVPAVSGLRVKYGPHFYLPLALLHAGLSLRVAGGIFGDFPLRRIGSEINAAALAVFAATLIAAVASARHAKRQEYRTNRI